MAGILFWLSVLIVFYVYLGYPLILTFLAMFRPRLTTYQDLTPKVTLLISAYNEEDVIASKLENSLLLEYPRDHLQILVAADGSDDRTVEIVRAFADRGVDLCFQPERRGKIAAISHAMPLARHEIVVFSDANNLYTKDALSQLVKPFSDPTIGGVSGSKHIVKGDNSLSEADSLYWRYESYIKIQETRLGCCVGVSGEVFAIRHSLYRTLPENIINDDFFIALNIIREGYRIVYVPEARSYEGGSLSEKDEMTRRTRIVAGRYQAMARSFSLLPGRQPFVTWQILSHKFLRPLVPFAMIAALAGNLIALFTAHSGSYDWLHLAPPFGWLFLGFQLIFYGVAWLESRLKIGGFLGKILYVPTFLANSNLAALLGLIYYLIGKQTVLWKRVPRHETGNSRNS